MIYSALSGWVVHFGDHRAEKNFGFIMKAFKEVAKTWHKDKAYQKAYDALEGEYMIAAALIEARAKAGMTQVQLAKKLKTTQPAIARLESGKQLPSAATLFKIAEATGSRLQISFVDQ